MLIALCFLAALAYTAVSGVAMRLLEEAGCDDDVVVFLALVWPAVLVVVSVVAGTKVVALRPYELTGRLLARRKRPELPAAKVVQR
jgi:uncharacterized RDD family membrane protein YckC